MDFNKLLEKLGLKNSTFLKSSSYNGLLAIIALILLNIVALDYNFTIDLTKDGTYSLSDASKQTVRSLIEPMNIKIFYSSQLAAEYEKTRLQLQDLMQSYDFHANENFKFEFMDVTKQEVKDEAESFGIYPVQIPQRAGGDSVQLDLAYIGAAITYGDLIETVNEINSTQGLEYRITSAMTKMVSKFNTLNSLDGNITLKLYVSDNLQQYQIFPADIDTQLDTAVKNYVDEVNQENFGKLTYSFEKLPGANIDTIAGQYGFTVFSWPEMSTQNGDVIPAGKGLIGVLVSSGEKFQALSVGLQRSIFGFQLSGIDNLGSRINQSIDSMVSNNPVLGYVNSGQTRTFDQNDQQSAQAFQQLISKLYEIRLVDLSAGPVPESIKTLVVNGPKQAFSEAELYRIDNFIMKGGSVLFLIDPYIEYIPQQQAQQMQQPFYIPISTGLNQLFKTYGFGVEQKYVLDKESFIARQQGQSTPIYFAPLVSSDRMSGENSSTRYLKEVLLLKTAPVTIDEEVTETNNISVTKLLTSSEEAWTMEGQINLNPMMISIPSADKLDQYNFAVMAEGKFPSYFASGPPEDIASVDEDLTLESSVEKGVATARIAIIGTSELTNQQLIDPTGTPNQGDFIYNNTLFIQNIIDELNGNDSIPQMRSKGLVGRLPEIEERVKVFNKTMNIGALPLLAVLIGLLFYRIRIVRKKEIQKMFTEAE
jgi:ABC-2 type transport system permease protein